MTFIHEHDQEGEIVVTLELLNGYSERSVRTRVSVI